MPDAPHAAHGNTRRVMFQPSPVGPPSSVDRIDPDASMASTTNLEDRGGVYASGAEVDDEDEEPDEDEVDEQDFDDEEEEEEEGEGDGEQEAASTTSSQLYDRDEDPVAFATRLDELAGVLEMGQVESTALKWGPAMGKQRNAPKLSMAEFKDLVDHHLSTTEWQFNPPSELFSPLPGRLGVFGGSEGNGFAPLGQSEGIHPIRVLGASALGHGIGSDDAEREF